MLEHRSLRFAVEVLILVAVAGAVTVAALHPLVIAGLMLFAWVVVSILEWAMLQSESHFESGLPPRYFVPELRVPLPRYLEHGYPPVPAPPEEIAWVVDTPAAPAEWPSIAALDEVPAPEPVFVPEVEEPQPVEELQADEPVPAVLEPEAEASLPEPEPELDDRLLADQLQSEEPGPANWFDSELPGLPPLPEPDADRLLDEEPVVDDVRREDADLAEWFTAKEPAPRHSRIHGLLDRMRGRRDLEEEIEAVPESEARVAPLEPVEELQADEPVSTVPEPEAEAPLPEPEPKLGYKLLAEELQHEESSPASWFDSELPGLSLLPEPDADWLLEEELRALEAERALPDPEPEPEVALEPVVETPLPEQEPEPELDYKLLVEQLRFEEPSPANWFDSELPGVPGVPQVDTDRLLAEELQALEAEWAAPEPEPEPEVAAAEPEQVEAEPEPVEGEAPEVELDYKLLAEQLRAGDPNPAEWFDAELPGSTFVFPELAELDEEELPDERPLAERERRHFWQRQHDDESATVEVLAQPVGRRLFHGRSKRDN